jgi:WD40 repeat protein
MRNNGIFALVILSSFFTATSFAQTPSASPTPSDNRGLGIQSGGPAANTSGNQGSREAKPELVLQTGYSNFYGASRLLFSPDGRLLATGTYRSNTIKLWETATNRKLRDLSSGGQAVSALAPSVAFSRDSRLIAASGGDNSVTVWDVNSGRELHKLGGSSQSSMIASLGVYFIVFTSDNRLVTISDAVRVWDLSSGRELRTLEADMIGGLSGFNGSDSGLTLSPDGTQLLLITMGIDPEVRIMDLASGREVRRVKLPDDQIDSLHLSFNSEGHLLAAGIHNKRFKFWDLTAKKERELGPTSKEFCQVKFSRDGRLLALSESYTVKLWDTATFRELPALTVPTSINFPQGDAFVSFTEDGKRIATGGIGTDTIVWETETGKRLSTMNGRTNMAYNVTFSADGMELISGGRTRWDLRTGRGLRIVPDTSEKTYGTASPDGRVVVLRRANTNVLTIVESPSGRQLQKLTPSGDTGDIQRTRFSADSSMLAVLYGPLEQQQTSTVSFTRGAQVKIWDVKNGRELRSITPTEIPMEAEFTTDGRSIVIIGMGHIALWDVQSGNNLRDLTASPVNTFTPPVVRPGQMPTMPNMADISAMVTNTLGTVSAGTMGQSVTSAAFTGDGRILATGGVESKSNIDFAAMMNSAMQRPKKGAKPPDPADMMKDFKIEAVGHVQFWDVASGRQIAAIKGHGRGVSKVAFSRDGKLLASGATDSTIKIWDAATQKELRTLSGHTAAIESIDFSPDGRLLASASDDGSTFIWDTKTGEHLLTLISLDDGGEWMVVTPQGLFDGTPVSWNQILWRYNQETFNVAPIEWFFNEFYYPGLLADIFNGKRPKVTQDVSKKDRRQPVVKLSLVGQSAESSIATRTVKVKIDVSDAPADKDNPKGTGAQDVRLFRNGSLVKLWRGDVLKGQSTVSLEQEITVTTGPNRLVAYGFNRDNVKSKDAPLVFSGAESLKRKGTAYIIAVGVNEYANSQYNLKYATADARSFADEMRRRQSQIGGFERVEVVQLLDQDATKANILAAISRLTGATGPPTLKASPLDALKRVEPEDTVVIYFAGHGTAQSQRFYLIPHDLGYTGDRTKLTEQGLNTMLAHSISDVELEAAVEGLDAGHLLLIIDACNSGQALEAEEKRRGPMNSKGLAQLAYEKGMYILTAAQSFQAALEAAQLGHGYLTYALVEEGLKTPVADSSPKDGVVIAREWLNFATERVPQMQEEKMSQGRGLGLEEITFSEGEKRSVQRPRVFYRRELEANPLVITKP